MAARVLIITAELRLPRVLQVALSNDGHHPETSLTGPDGPAVAVSKPPAVVILDCELPDPTGADAVRGPRRRSRAPVVALSGDAGTPETVNVPDAGADNCVSMPAALAELPARLRAVRRRASAETGVPLASVSRHLVDVASRCALGPG